MSKAAVRKCNNDCDHYGEHKLKPSCTYGGGLCQVKYNGPCVFELSSIIIEPSETDSELEQSAQRAPWMRTDDGEVGPAPRPDGH